MTGVTPDQNVSKDYGQQPLPPKEQEKVPAKSDPSPVNLQEIAKKKDSPSIKTKSVVPTSSPQNTTISANAEERAISDVVKELKPKRSPEEQIQQWSSKYTINDQMSHVPPELGDLISMDPTTYHVSKAIPQYGGGQTFVSGVITLNFTPPRTLTITGVKMDDEGETGDKIVRTANTKKELFTGLNEVRKELIIKLKTELDPEDAKLAKKHYISEIYNIFNNYSNPAQDTVLERITDNMVDRLSLFEVEDLFKELKKVPKDSFLLQNLMDIVKKYKL